MKAFLTAASLLVLSSSAMAGQLCRIDRTELKAGVGSNAQQGTFIYVDNQGYLPVIKTEGQIYYAKNASVNLQTLFITVNGIKMKLVNCYHIDDQLP